jgi:hypothetical protein
MDRVAEQPDRAGQDREQQFHDAGRGQPDRADRYAWLASRRSCMSSRMLGSGTRRPGHVHLRSYASRQHGRWTLSTTTPPPGEAARRVLLLDSGRTWQVTQEETR